MKGSLGWRRAMLAGLAAVGITATMTVAAPAAAEVRVTPAASPPTIQLEALSCGSASQTSFTCVADGSVRWWYRNGVHQPAWDGLSWVTGSCVFQQVVVLQAVKVGGGSAIGGVTCGVTPPL